MQNGGTVVFAIMPGMKIITFACAVLSGLAAAWGECPRTVVGVVNWDCSLPSSTWFGHYATTSLSPAHFRHCTPFYADVKGPDQIDYHWRSVEEYEREMQYAIDAGIDYFAYCWYGELKPEDGKDFTPVEVRRENVCDPHVWELATARQLHAKSKLRDKLKMCAILVTLHPLADAEVESLARAMKEPWYQTAQGRPLLYLFGGKGKGLLPRIRKACRAVGAGDPYAVVLAGRKFPSDGDEGVQAISAYVDGAHGVDIFAETAARGRESNAQRVATGMDVIPTFTLGWDPRPRLEHPVPWCGYAKDRYMRPATESEWLKEAASFADWVKTNRKSCPTGHILSFAWNEFEEGGWICPTWRPDGPPDTSRVSAFRKVGEIFRRTLDEPPRSASFPPAKPVAGERSVTMFVAFTGRPTTADIEHKLDALAAGGVNSFMLYPTSGLGYEYLGKDFFDAARTFAAGAQRRRMKMWLYDEHNWPSGSCLGRVPATDEAFREWQLTLFKEGTNTSWRKVLSPISTSSMCAGGFRKGWPNLLEPRAVDLFTRMTHDVYAKELAPWFADGTVRGIFTDEPFHPVLGKWLPKGTLRAVRWYDGLLEDYAALTGGGDFKRDVEAWFAAGQKTKGVEVWTRYNELYARRFKTSFFDRIRAKTDALGILATGHMIGEHSPDGSVTLNGDPLASLATLSFPGMDEISTRTDPGSIEWLTLHTVQYAIRRNGRGGMAELFALGPANATPAKFLKMLRICALHGVTRYFTVMSAMDASWMDEMHGFTVGVGDQQPWFAEFPTFLAAADEASATAAKRAVFDVALRFPRKLCVQAAAGAVPRPDVNGFLRAFECAQTGVELIREEDATAASLVFAFEGKAFCEERTGTRFDTPRAALAWAQARLPKRFILRDAEGRPVPDVLVRNYEDGTHAYVRLGKVPPAPTVGTPVALDGDWMLTLSAAPTRRLPFDTNGICRLSLKNPLKGARLATRGTTVTVDGRTIPVASPCNALRPSFNGLYRTSETFDLTAGDHEFRLPGDLRDPNWFLPAAFLIEPMAAPQQVKPASLDALGFGGFCGSTTWTKTVTVPQGEAVRLLLETGGHFTRVFLDGRDLGAVGWDDFSWEIPADLRGKTCELRIVVHTSLAPLFGAANPPGTKYWGATSPRACGLLSVPQWLVLK